MEFLNEYNAEEWKNINNEFKRIQDTHYLDHAGATLYSEKQLSDCYENLSTNLYCNPHTSKSTEDLIDQVRYKILKHFNTNSNEYQVVFTSGSTASLKLIAECFNFKGNRSKLNENTDEDNSDVEDDDDDENDNDNTETNLNNNNNNNGTFLYLRDNHTSILGMREIVRTQNIEYLEKYDLLKNHRRHSVSNEAHKKNCTITTKKTNSLFVYPAQCNFSGYKYSLDHIDFIQKNGFLNDWPINGRTVPPSPSATDWYIALDAACYASTNQLDLNKYKPDFVCISFYKLFGYPTGIGALLVSERGINAIDKKKYYGGGTVKIAMSGKNWHRKRDCFYERMEDGTIAFLSIISLLQGFRTIERLVPIAADKTHSNSFHSMCRISRHCFNLANYLQKTASQIKYPNGNPIIKFYHDKNTNNNSSDGSISIKEQGGIINFNVLHEDGSFIGFAEISCMASIHNIYLRTGCFCNPGACQRYLALTNDQLKLHYKAGHICGDSNDLIDGVPTGSVRVSFGYMTEKRNVDAVIDMLRNCYVFKKSTALLQTINIEANYKLNPNWNGGKQKNILIGNTPQTLSLIKPNHKKSFAIRLRQICIYPIKSCGSFKIDTKWQLNRNGFKYDREWMIVNGNGVCLTQKTETKLCLITPIIQLNENQMILQYPNKKSISIPLRIDNDRDSLENLSLCQSKVCGDRIDGIDCGDSIADWLSDSLDIDGLRLIRQCEDNQRLLKKNNAEAKHTIALSNQAQFLLINTMSVDWLARKVEDWNELEPYTDDRLESVIDRFRGNLIIEAPDILDELTWKSITFNNGITLNVQGPCTRCQMICIDQQTGIKTTEPLRTIAKEFQGKMKFGVYLSQTMITYDDDGDTDSKNGNTNIKTNEYYINCNDTIFITR